MRAVWSFWTKPFFGQHGTKWLNIAYYLMSWVLSIETAKQHYAETCLVTDDNGARILTEEVGLEFSHVSKELNALDNHDPRWFTLGKILAYRAQTNPFVHIDSDVYLWKPLPPHLTAAPLFAQNPEYFSIQSSVWYRPDLFEQIIDSNRAGWIPEEWQWYRKKMGTIQKAECCGILGANNLAFIRHYANLVINMLEHPYNRRQLLQAINVRAFSILLEQYTLSTCIDYHQGLPHSPFRDIHIEYLFKSTEEAYQRSAEKGFTHLMLGNLKSNKSFAEQVAKTVKKKYPEQYDRCLACAKKLNIKTYPNKYVLLTNYNQEPSPPE